MSEFEQDLCNSNNVIEKIKPIICKLLMCDSIVTVEGVNNDVCKLLDLTCGIDYLKVTDKAGNVSGIANRIQWIDPPWPPFNTFTIRKGRESGVETEFTKRKKAIDNGGLYPYLTMHTYVEAGTERLLSLAVAKTTDIIDYIIKHKPEERYSVDSKGKAWFYFCPWADMIDKGYRVLTCENIGKNMDILFTQYPAKGA